jgi:signal transduction histidine kinase
LSLKAILLTLVLVPSIALVSLWSLNWMQLYTNWHSANDLDKTGKGVALPVLTIFYNLQAERQLSAAALIESKTYRAQLTQQRQRTDASIKSFRAVEGTAPASSVEQLKPVRRDLEKLPGLRTSVDRGSATQQKVYDGYTSTIASDLQLFQTVAATDSAEISTLVRPWVAAQWGKEILSREDAIITTGVLSGELSKSQRSQLAELIGTHRHIYGNELVPLLPSSNAKDYRDLMAGTAWKQMSRIERGILNAEATDGRFAVSAKTGKEWRQSIDTVGPQLEQATNRYSGYLTDINQSELADLKRSLIVNSAVGAAVILLVILISVRFSRVLRRRILSLRAAALELQTKLPDMVGRLQLGETVDTDAELPALRYGTDELGMLGHALNQARGSALDTAVQQVEQYRGFERLLQRIARRTQLLIGMQMKRLGEMERRHEDPEVLEGLFDLDHLAARLRRYEENLVILGGGQPQRRWRKPVLLLDVLRSAQGEVRDYRRIRIETDGETWLSERAVGPMVHVLAELMENAVAFSKPPTPVEVTASRVGHGVAIEIEDRGMGMVAEQYAEANQMMAAPPRMDVMSRADDARLGLYVVARLSASMGLKVEFRPSAFGGTRVVVLLPGALISEWQPLQDETPGAVPAQLAVVAAPHSGETGDSSGRFPQAQLRDQPHPPPAGEENITRPLIGPWVDPPVPTSSSAPSSAAMSPRQSVPSHEPSADPLPRRVRQASLVTELRTAPPAYDGDSHTGPAEKPLPRRGEPRRAGAAVGAFQRQSRMSRFKPAPDRQSTHSPSPGPDRTRKEDTR